MKSLISIPELDFEYKLWKNRLKFYDQETKIYLARLMSIRVQDRFIADKYSDDLKEMIVRIQAMEKEIRLHEEEIACFKKDYPINFRHAHYLDHESIRNKFESLEQSYHKLIRLIVANVHAVHLA